MKNLVLSAVALVAIAATAQAQDLRGLPALTEAALEEHLFPMPALNNVQAPVIPKPFIGVHVGFEKITDADNASMFAGFHIDFPTGPILEIEVALDFHSADFNGGDTEYTSYNFFINAKMLHTIKSMNSKGYILLGVGLANWTAEYSGGLAGTSKDTGAAFAFSIGGGLEMTLDTYILNFDLRYMFQSPDLNTVADLDSLGSIQFTLGFSFPF